LLGCFHINGGRFNANSDWQIRETQGLKILKVMKMQIIAQSAHTIEESCNNRFASWGEDLEIARQSNGSNLPIQKLGQVMTKLVRS